MEVDLYSIKSATRTDRSKASNLYWNRMEDVYHILRFFGYVPYSVNKGDGRLGPSAGAWLWIAVTGLVQLWIVAEGDKYYLDPNRWDTYDSVLESFIRIFFTHTMILWPIFWLENRKIVKYINDWTDFIARFDALASSPLTCFSRRKFQTILIAIGVYTFVAILMTQIFVQNGILPYLALCYFITSYLTAVITIFWAANCVFLNQVTNSFKRNLLVTFSKGPNPAEIKAYRTLWHELHLKIVNFPDVIKCIIGAHVFLNVFCLSFTVYVWTTALFLTKNMHRVVGFSLPILWYTVTVAVICESSYSVTRTVRRLIYEALSFKISAHNDEHVFAEIDLLFQAFEASSPDIVIHGTLTLNRNFFVTVFSETLSYIIVLSQFDETLM